MWITFYMKNTINWHINQRERYENRVRKRDWNIQSKVTDNV